MTCGIGINVQSNRVVFQFVNNIKHNKFAKVIMIVNGLKAKFAFKKVKH
jgi:hypothetical protein